MEIKDEKEMVIQRSGSCGVSCNGDSADDIASSGQDDDYNYTAHAAHSDDRCGYLYFDVEYR
jgi:hypothetical protein